MFMLIASRVLTVLAVLAGLSTFGCWLYAASIMDSHSVIDDRWGTAGGVMVLATIVLSALAGCMWDASDDDAFREWKNRPRMTREQRRKLREEQGRIALAAAIEKAEKEAGIYRG